MTRLTALDEQYLHTVPEPLHYVQTPSPHRRESYSTGTGHRE